MGTVGDWEVAAPSGAFSALSQNELTKMRVKPFSFRAERANRRERGGLSTLNPQLSTRLDLPMPTYTLAFTMKALRVNLLAVSFLSLSLFVTSALAVEKAGLLVEISKKVVNRNDKVTVNGVGNMEIDHDMTLKMDVKNTSSKDLPETPIESVVLIQRYFSESATFERYTGTAKITPLHPAQVVSVDVGSFHIGGHMHGSSDMHVDKVAAWKITLTRDGQKVEFTSGSNFETLNKRAKDATK